MKRKSTGMSFIYKTFSLVGSGNLKQKTSLSTPYLKDNIVLHPHIVLPEAKLIQYIWLSVDGLLKQKKAPTWMTGVKLLK